MDFWFYFVDGQHFLPFVSGLVGSVCLVFSRLLILYLLCVLRFPSPYCSVKLFLPLSTGLWIFTHRLLTHHLPDPLASDNFPTTPRQWGYNNCPHQPLGLRPLCLYICVVSSRIIEGQSQLARHSRQALERETLCVLKSLLDHLILFGLRLLLPRLATQNTESMLAERISLIFCQ